MMVRVLVVRHGETSWNAVGRYQGCLDTRLSREGRRQVLQLARGLARRRIDAVYASPLRRARETAVAIAAGCGCPHYTEPALREICHGRWEGLTVKEVAARFPRLWALWRTRPDRVRMPGGESLADVEARAVPGLQGIVRRHPGGTVCVVTHGVTARVILARALGRPPAALWSIDSPPVAISELRFTRRGHVVGHLNRLVHLASPPRAHAAL